jgi:epoxide hydrolase
VNGVQDPGEIRPFTISVPDGALADLRERLARTRWAPGPVSEAGRYGVSGAWLGELAEYRREGYD